MKLSLILAWVTVVIAAFLAARVVFRVVAVKGGAKAKKSTVRCTGHI
jgi:hypothetical protein